MAATIIRDGVWLSAEGTLAEVMGQLRAHAVDPTKALLTFNASSNTYVAIMKAQK